MSDKTRTRRRDSAASEAHSAATTASKPASKDRREVSFNNVFERLSFGVAKEGLGDELGASNAMLRGAVELREMQIEAARCTQAAHEQASERLKSARSIAELTSVGLMLAQADAEGAVRYWSELAGIAARVGLQGWNDAFGAAARAQGMAHSVGQHWLDAAASVKPEIVEAQVEHLTTPVTSSPFVWPAQEAVREAMTLGARNWNEWLASAVPAAAKVAEAAGAAAASVTRH